MQTTTTHNLYAQSRSLWLMTHRHRVHLLGIHRHGQGA